MTRVDLGHINLSHIHFQCDKEEQHILVTSYTCQILLISGD